MNDDVEGFYTILYNKMNVVRGGFPGSKGGIWRRFPYRIGVEFVGIVVQNLIVYGMDPIPILYQHVPLKVVLF